MEDLQATRDSLDDLIEELPEVFSEGETLEEAKTNLLDALAQVLEYHREEARKNAVPGALREELQLAQGERLEVDVFREIYCQRRGRCISR